MEERMKPTLEAIFQRRAVKAFEPVEIPQAQREMILDAARLAPSSFNIQPYRFYWVESPAMKKGAAQLCMSQSPAVTASALVVAVADIGSWRSTIQGHLEWVRQSGLSPQKISDYERRAKFGKWFFVQGWFGILGLLKWIALRVVNLWKIIGMAPVSRNGLFKWATKNTSLACENLMIAAEALGLNSCPMEGFDGRRLSKFLGLNPRYHEIVMVIAIGKKSNHRAPEPQWRRPLDATVTVL
jgi:nitroreductase